MQIIWCFQRFLRGQDVPAWRKQQKTTRRVLPEISDFIDLKRITCPRSRRFIFEAKAAFSRSFAEDLGWRSILEVFEVALSENGPLSL
jgi:hypothetical protein